MNPLVAVLLCVGLFSAGSYLRPAFAQENESGAIYIYLKANGGNDDNDGSYEAPFASFKPLQTLANSITTQTVNVQFWPGIYPITAFKWPGQSSWKLSACTNCSLEDNGASDDKVIVSPIPSPAPFIFGSREGSWDRVASNISIENITFTPLYNGEANSVFSSSLFNLDYCGFSASYVEVSDFYLAATDMQVPIALFSRSYSNFFEIRNSSFLRNTLINPEQAVELPLAMFGNRQMGVVEGCRFESNFVTARTMKGGLFRLSGNFTLIDTVFFNNSGTCDYCDGLIMASEARYATIRVDNCDFLNTSLTSRLATISPTMPPSEIVGAATAAIFSQNSAVSTNWRITRSRFLGNTADRGTAFAISRTSLSSEPITFASNRGSDVLIQDCHFVDNRAVLGIGATIWVQDGLLTNHFEIDRCTFHGNTAPYNAYQVVNGATADQVTSTDPSLISLNAIPGAVSISTVLLEGGIETLSRHGGNFSDIHRIAISKTNNASITNVETNEAIPNSGPGAFLTLESVHHFTLEGWHIGEFPWIKTRPDRADGQERPQPQFSQDLRSRFENQFFASDPQFGGSHLLGHFEQKRSQASPFSVWVLFLIHTDPDFLDPSQSVSLSKISFDSWDYDHDVTIIASQDIVNLEIQDLTWKAFDSPVTEPVILVRSGVNVFLRNSSFEMVNPGILISRVTDSVFISDVTMLSPPQTSIPRIAVEHTTRVIVERFKGDGGEGPLILVQNVISATVSESSFSNCSLNSAQGALTSRQALLLDIVRSNFTLNRGVQGPALYTDAQTVLTSCIFSTNAAFGAGESVGDGGAIYVARSGSLSATDSLWDSNVARLDGGAIASEGAVYLKLCNFIANAVYGGAGGALVVRIPEGLALTVEDSIFLNNNAYYAGGALSVIKLGEEATTYISRCKFTRNVLANLQNKEAWATGGAIHSLTTTIITDSDFSGNFAWHGGAVALDETIPSPNGKPKSPSIIQSSRFSANEGHIGGALLLLGVDPATYFPIIISANNFTKNSAYDSGGAIAVIDSCLNLSSTSMPPDGREVLPNRFSSNSGRYGGGAIFLSNTNWAASIGRQVFEGNDSDKCCGAILYYGSILKSSFTQPDSTLCELATCTGNKAPWGVEMASLRVNLTPHFVNPPTTPYNDAPDDHSHGDTVYRFYPGIERTLYTTGTDQFGQIATTNAAAPSLLVTFQCESEQILCNLISFDWAADLPSQETHLRFETNFPSNTQHVLSVTFRLPSDTSSMLAKPIVGFLVLNPADPSIEGPNGPPPRRTRIPLKISIDPCGPGFGQSPTVPSTCELCPLNYYSLNGTCATCAYDSKVKSCIGNQIDAPATYWVSTDPSNNAYTSFKCAESYCDESNSCTHHRTGPLCGQCIPGKHQSLTSLCSDCNKANPVMITLALAALWIGSIILHTLVVVSSGKSTILIFFVQTAFSIRFQIPLSNLNGPIVSPTFHKMLEYATCLMPLDYLQRSLLIASVPFIMMLQLCITFFIYYLLKMTFNIGNKAELSHETKAGLSTDITDSGAIGYDLSDENKDGKIKSNDVKPYEASVELDGDANDETSLLHSNAIESDSSSDSNPFGSFSEESDPLAKQTMNTIEAQYQWKDENHFFHPHRLTRTLLSLFAGSYSSVLGVVTSTVTCIKLLDGQEVLRASPSISCTSKYFKSFQLLYALFVPYLVITFGVILAKLVHGYFKKTLSRTDVRFGVWYEMYKPHLFAWKVTEMLRRLAIAAVSNLLISDPSTRASLLCLLTLTFLTIHMLALPYRQRLENGLEALSLITLTTISALVLWYTRQSTRLQGPATAATALMFGVTVVIVCAFAINKVPSAARLWQKITSKWRS